MPEGEPVDPPLVVHDTERVRPRADVKVPEGVPQVVLARRRTALVLVPGVLNRR